MPDRSDSKKATVDLELLRVQRELAHAVRARNMAEEVAASSEKRGQRTNADLVAEIEQLREAAKTTRLIAKAEVYLELAAQLERDELTASVLRDRVAAISVGDGFWARGGLGSAFLTVDDVARLFGVKTATVKAWARSGQVPAVGIGDGRKVWAFHRGTLEAWANSKSEENLGK